MTSGGALGPLLESSLGLLGTSWHPLGVLVRILRVLLGQLLKTYMGKRVPLGALGCQNMKVITNSQVL